MCQCPHCGKIYSKFGIKAHIWRVHGEGQKFKSSFNAGLYKAHIKQKCEKCGCQIATCNYTKHYRICGEKTPKTKKCRGSAWNKGLSSSTDNRVAQGALKLKLYYTTHIASNKGRAHTLEEKQHLSKMRKIFLTEHPEKVPYLLNHSSKESYPEKYFAEVFNNEGLLVVRYFQISLYQIDFAIPDRKIAIEIDGEQHYVDEKVKRCDKNKESYLSNLGWKIYRIRWATFKKLSKEQKKEFIQNLIRKIRD